MIFVIITLPNENINTTLDLIQLFTSHGVISESELWSMEVYILLAKLYSNFFLDLILEYGYQDGSIPLRLMSIQIKSSHGNYKH